jgi:hypothetical protein
MSRVDEWLAWVQAELGKPYVWGDEGPNSFDCSGLVQYTLAKVGLSAPRTARAQQAWATPVAQPAPGDLVFWGTPATHVAVYVGGDQVINAPRPGTLVRQQAIWGQPTYGRVPDLGAGALHTATGVVAGLSESVGGWLGGLRGLSVEALAVLFGLALVGLGLWRLSAGARAATRANIQTNVKAVTGL